MLSTKRKMLVARILSTTILGARSALARDPQVIVRRRAINWRLDLREGIDIAIYFGLYQRIPQHVVQTWVSPGSVVFDIGANIGALSLPLALTAGPSGCVVCVEPTDYAFSKLEANAALNPELADRLVLLQAALIDKPPGAAEPNLREKPLFYSRWPLQGGASSRHVRHLGQLELARGARFVPLDELYRELVVNGRIRGPLSFVKLDVDGNELAVLHGGKMTFTQYRPAIHLEIAPHVQDEVPGRFEELLQTLQVYGYRLESGSGQIIPMSAGSLRNLINHGGSIDVLAVPH
jgi:FkbM family methyltransferase